MRILALDSSGLVASVALLEDDVVLGEYSTNFHKTHSVTLLPMLDELMRMLSLNAQEAGIGAIAVAKGPGSFTGLRIGGATAKGLALALSVPIYPVSTLAGLAYNAWGRSGLICPIMDARRNQVYTAVYRFSEGESISGEQSPADVYAVPEASKHTAYSAERTALIQTLCMMEECAPGAKDILEIIDVLNRRKESVTFVGDGIPVFADTIREHLCVPFSFAPQHMNRQRAASVGALAMAGFADPVSGGDFAPEYLRLSQAERERLQRQTV